MSPPEFPFDLIRAELQQPGDGVFRETDWLTASWRNPDEFAHALLRHHTAASSAQAPIKSSAEAGYDLYYDLVLRHQAAALPALLWTELASGLHTMTYAQLHAACTLRGAHWTAQGVKAGEHLCILAPLGPELLVDLLTGLRLGLRISLLPPSGMDFLAPRLGALPKSRIATAPRYQLLLGKDIDRERILSATPGDTAAPASATSHTYAPDEPMLALFSPLCEPPAPPTVLSAAAAYDRALCDGLLLLGLKPGKVLAAPEHSLLQYQPALLLTTLLQGATYLHLGARDLLPRNMLLADARAEVRTEVRMDILLVSAALRDVMLKQPARRLPGIELWLVSPQEPPSQAWDDWAQRCGLENTPAAALLIDAACGGAVLFSLRRRGRVPQLIQPAPGVPFSIMQADDSGEPARSGYGVWDPLPDATGILLRRRDQAFLYAGTLAPTRHGQVYPSKEVEQVALTLPFVLAASVVTADSEEVTLLVFTGPEPIDSARARSPSREAALRDSIRHRLGPEFLPTTIEQYAMYPRRQGSALDHLWCTRQYQRGSLREREEHPLFRLLDRLRAACNRPRTPEPPQKPMAAGRFS